LSDSKYIRILGIDPGSVNTGYGIIETDGRHHKHLVHGKISPPVADDFPSRLGQIFAGVSALLDEWQPQEMAVEEVFVSNNAMSALKLGQARGAALSAAHGRSLIIAEYTPRLVKQALVGSGAADKAQVQHMVTLLLNLQQKLQADAADALAVAICHSHSRGALPAASRKRSQRWRL